MASVSVNFGGRFYSHFSLVFNDFEGFFNKTIQFALVGYEMISYPARARGIIVK